MALDDALTADDVAAMLRVSRNTVYNLVKRDQLASYHVGRKMRFTRADVENYIARSARGTLASQARGAAGASFEDGGAEGAPFRRERAAHGDAADTLAVPREAATVPEEGGGIPYGDRPGSGARGPVPFVVAGNDVIGDVLANYLGGMGFAVERRYEDSYAALVSLYLGRAGAALTHLPAPSGAPGNVAAVERLVPAAPIRLVRLAERQQGLIVARGNPKGIFSWKDLVRPDVRIVNRERGSGSRILFDAHLAALAQTAGSRVSISDLSARVNGYDTIATSALAMASYVERGVADAGVGPERVARQVEGVDFVPLQLEALDVALSLDPAARPASDAVTGLTRTRAFREEVAAITGYDVRTMGRVLLER